MKIEKKFTFRSGKHINCIKHARYGNKIFVMISETPRVTDDRKYTYDRYMKNEKNSALGIIIAIVTAAAAISAAVYDVFVLTRT